MLKIGNIILDVPYFQASLSGYSDYAMRAIAREFGAPMTFAGVMLAKSVIHPKVFNKPSFKPGGDEHPIGAQLLGEDAEVMAKAAKAVRKVGFDLIDLNFACPAPKVLRRKRGGYLLNEPDKVIEIYNAVRQSVDCPVTMKLRTSFNNESYDNFRDICTRAVAGGVDALIVHPRAVCQRFTGSADWRFLSEVKKQFPHTIIIGSGDLFSADTIKNNIKNTGIDGAVIARGAIGNPWIFSQLREGEKFIPPTLEQQGEVILKHFDLVCKLYKHKKAVGYFRKFTAIYCKLHPLRRKAQKTLFAAKTVEEVLAGIKEWYGV
ncbi:MAG: tRNA-dihydrouridine synthase family protein [Phycisphaerae bacterium]|nr:tRNA-dihydrouridine synthase family protein [Phycisphaerae bacterium]